MGTYSGQSHSGRFRQWEFPEKYSSYNDLILEEKPLPDASKLGPTSVLVKTHAVSLQFRDVAISKGTYSMPVRPNLVPCSDAAGEVVAVGSEVKKWSKGDRVCANFNLGHLAGQLTEQSRGTSLGGSLHGVLTEYREYPADSLVKVPDYMTYEEASTLPCATLTAYSSLLGHIPLKGGDVVLVLGSGGVAIAGMQFALASGASVIVTTSSSEKAEKIKKLGATHVINYKENPKWEEEVLRLTGGRGVDHVLENGGPQTVTQSAACLKLHGIIHMVGFVGGFEGPPPTTGLVMQLLRKSAHLRGVLIGSVAQFEDMNRLLDHAKIHPVIDKVFSFEQVHEAYAYLESQKHIGKVVIKVVN